MNRTRIGLVQYVTALISYITRCYGKHVAIFTFAVATGDIIKYQWFVYGSFVWEIHVRYTCIINEKLSVMDSIYRLSSTWQEKLSSGFAKR